MDHPDIIPFYDAGEAGGVLLASELVTNAITHQPGRTVTLAFSRVSPEAADAACGGQGVRTVR